MKLSTTQNIIGQEQQTVNASIQELKSHHSINKDNFFDCTIANWTEVSCINFVADFKSESGSQYMHTDEGVYRMSNHWAAKTASCIWLLNNQESNSHTIAFCKWEDFKKYGSKRTSPSHTQDYIITMLIHGGMVKTHMIGDLTF